MFCYCTRTLYYSLHIIVNCHAIYFDILLHLFLKYVNLNIYDGCYRATYFNFTFVFCSEYYNMYCTSYPIQHCWIPWGPPDNKWKLWDLSQKYTSVFIQTMKNMIEIIIKSNTNANLDIIWQNKSFLSIKQCCSVLYQLYTLN